MTIDRQLRNGVLVLLGVVSPLLAGCGESGAKTYSLSGVVEWTGSDANPLTGHLVELTHTSDPTIRAAGVIDSSGRFRVETLDQGVVKPGIREGIYRARLLIQDEGDGRSKPKIPKKYLDGKTSGWTVQVPASDDITLTVTK